MESTEKCEAVISHFNGKFLKTPAGVMGKCVLHVLHVYFKQIVHEEMKMLSLFVHPHTVSKSFSSTKEYPYLFFSPYNTSN